MGNKIRCICYVQTGTRQSVMDKMLHDILIQKICYCEILLQQQFVTGHFVTCETKQQIVTCDCCQCQPPT